MAQFNALAEQVRDLSVYAQHTLDSYVNTELSVHSALRRIHNIVDDPTLSHANRYQPMVAFFNGWALPAGLQVATDLMGTVEACPEGARS